METPPVDQPPASATEPTAPAPEAEPTDKRELWFLLGLALALFSIPLAQGISIITLGGLPGCWVPIFGLFLVGPMIVEKPLRFLGVGLLAGLLFAVPISAALWIRLICGPGPGC